MNYYAENETNALTNHTNFGIIPIKVKNMEFMTTKEAAEKWDISERRIRQLLQDGRIESAVKVGNSWNIPIDADKPVDKRIIKPDDNNFTIDLDDNYFDEVNSLKKRIR